MAEISSEENANEIVLKIFLGKSYLLKYMFMATPTTPAPPSPSLPALSAHLDM